MPKLCKKLTIKYAESANSDVFTTLSNIYDEVF